MATATAPTMPSLAPAGNILSLFQKNPASAANPYLQKMMEYIQQYMNPYINPGLQINQLLGSQYGSLTSDPTAMLAKLGAGYTQSPGYQYNVNEATRAANAAAAAGGMLGSPAEQAGLAKTVTGLASQDYQDYLRNAMGLYQTGLSGQQFLSGQGYDASMNAMNSILAQLLSQANLAYAGQGYQNRNQSGGISDILSMIGSFL